MRVKEKPLTIGDRTFASFEEFYQYVMQRQLPKDQVIRRVKQRLAEFEQKYDMTSEEFYRTIAGTPAEDEPDFIEWKMEYQAYLWLTTDDETSVQQGGHAMKVKEKPLTIGDRTFESVEEFYEYVMQRQLPKEKVIERVKGRLAEFEHKYGMTSEEFYRTIVGTPAEDEVDFIEWKIEYHIYLRLVAED